MRVPVPIAATAAAAAALLVSEEVWIEVRLWATAEAACEKQRCVNKSVTAPITRDEAQSRLPVQ